MALHPHGQVRCEASNAQDALMIGKTSRAVAMKHARPTTPKTANTAKDTFSTAKASLGYGDVFSFFRPARAPRSMSYFVCTALTSTAPHKLVKTRENW
jgi:hypothetical protein